VVGSGAGLVGGVLAAGVGHAIAVRPDPSTLGVVGEQGSHHEGPLAGPPRAPAQSQVRRQKAAEASSYHLPRGQRCPSGPLASAVRICPIGREEA
jgi:hypothetical protein